MQTAMRAILIESRAHPFHVTLSDGTLSLKTFERFLQQDALYLEVFSEALTKTAYRLKPPHQQLFHQLARNIYDEQVNLHYKYLPRPQGPLFFKSPVVKARKIAVVEEYTNHLVRHVSSASVQEAVASLIPCYYLYSSLGQEMGQSTKEDNPYQAWIDSYRSASFLVSTQLILQTLDALCANVNVEHEKKIIAACNQSAQFELAFWSSVCPIVAENNTPCTGLSAVKEAFSPV